MEEGTNAAMAIPSNSRAIIIMLTLLERKRIEYATAPRIRPRSIRNERDVLSLSTPQSGLKNIAVIDMLEVARPIRNGVAPITRAYLGMRGTTSWMNVKKSMLARLSRQTEEIIFNTKNFVRREGHRVVGIVFGRGI